jgi:hypothetical protein
MGQGGQVLGCEAGLIEFSTTSRSTNPSATTSAGREFGESLAMHQLAVWRVSNGSSAAVLSMR